MVIKNDSADTFNQDISGGTGRDIILTDRYKVLSPEDAYKMYRNNPTARACINIPIEDIYRKDIDVEFDTDGIIKNELTRLKWKYHFSKAQTWSDVFGGAVIIKGIDDGTVATKGRESDIYQYPVNPNTIKGINFLDVYDRRAIRLLREDICLDPTSKNYGKYDYVYIVDEIRGRDIKVHWSRFILWLGMELPREEMFANGGFGDSRLNHLIDTILWLTNAYSDTRQVIKTVYQDIFKTQALADMLDSNNPDGRKMLKDRMSLIDQSKASRNTLIADISEVFERLTINCSGIRDLVEVLQVALSSQTTIPVTKLFGLTSGGLNATKEQEQKNYYDVISSRQNNELLEKVEQLKEDICAYTGLDNKLMVISFPPLMQQTELEKAEMRKMHAETDNIYILNGTLNSEEVRLSRFGGERYSDDISLIEDSLVMQREANASDDNPLPSNVKGMANNTEMAIKKPKKEKVMKQIPVPKPIVDVKA